MVHYCIDDSLKPQGGGIALFYRKGGIQKNGDLKRRDSTPYDTMAGLKDLCIEIAPKIPGLAEHEFQTNSHRQDIFRLAPILAQFSFSTNELELDY